MDSITQAALGAAIGEALLGKRVGHRAAVAGALLATVPDLDVVLYLFYDKLEMLSIHRGLSHSILFSILSTFIIAYLLSRSKWFREIKYPLLYLFTWLTLFTHMLLDAFTAYGTQLFLPFSDRRIGFDSINVVDPVYTIPLIMGLILSLWIYRSEPHRGTYNRCGLIISSCYLLFTLVNKAMVENAVSDRFTKEKIEFDALLTMPVGIANIYWYGVAKNQDSLYMYKYNSLNKRADAIDVFPINEHYLEQIDSEVADKMRWFAKGFYTVEGYNDKIRIYNLQVDMWGVVRTGDHKAPTAGYFEVSNVNGKKSLSSGSIRDY